MIVLVMNSWLPSPPCWFSGQFCHRQQLFPSVLTEHRRCPYCFVGRLQLLATGDTASKTVYQNTLPFEPSMFQLSQTSTDFGTQQFNEKLLAVYNQADELVTLYEQNHRPGRRR